MSVPSAAYGPPGGAEPPRPRPVATAAPEPEQKPTCWRCDRTLAGELTPPWSMRCPRCKADNRSKDLSRSD